MYMEGPVRHEAIRDMTEARSLALIIGLALGARSLRGETIWDWTHEASVTGSANVFDGGPVVFESATTEGPDDSDLLGGAGDYTRPGSQGASYATGGASIIVPSDVRLVLSVNFSSSYASSLFAGGDRSGGAGEGTLSSVIEFVMPTEELIWDWGYGSEQDIGFEGHATVTLENVTQNKTLLSIAGEGRYGDITTLIGRPGDVIRLTSEMAGGGSVPANLVAVRGYDASFTMRFTVPEPATLSLLILGVIPFTRPERLRRAR